MRRKFLIRLAWALGLLLTLSLTLFWFAPASMLGYWLEKQQSPLQLGMIKGSMRDGQAKQVYFNGIDVGTLNWQLGNFQLRPLGAQLQFQVNGIQVQADGKLNMRLSEPLTATEMRGYFPANWLDLQGLAPFLFAHGTINFDLNHIELAEKSAPDIRGNINWDQAGLNGLITAELGELLFNLDKQPAADSQLVVNFSNSGDADIYMNGVINSDGRIYQLSANARASTKRNDIGNFLQRIGKLQNNGMYQIEFSGNLFPDEK